MIPSMAIGFRYSNTLHLEKTGTEQQRPRPCSSKRTSNLDQKKQGRSGFLLSVPHSTIQFADKITSSMLPLLMTLATPSDQPNGFTAVSVSQRASRARSA